jgi:4-amino-4-deoxy-L-arabinose transferase-like glycosyltransferase
MSSLQESTGKVLDSLRRRPTLVLMLMATAVFCCHLAWGVWFFTASPTNAPKTGLSLQGEDFLKSIPTWDTEHEADAAFHNRAAVGVLETGIPRTRTGGLSDHSPLYAYFLAGCYWLGGIRLLSVAIPQAAASALVAVLLGLTARRLGRDELGWLAGLVTPLLVLCHYRLATFSAYISPTMLLLLIFSGALFAVSHATVRGTVIFTLAIGAGIFTHAAFFVVGGAAGLWLLFQFGRKRQVYFLGCAAGLLMLVSLKLLLSLVKLDAQPDDHIRKATQGTLWHGNNPYYESLKWWQLWEPRLGVPAGWSKWRKTEEEEHRRETYLERTADNWQKAALLWIRENPGQYAKLCFIRLRTELGPFTADMSPINKAMGTGLWLLVYPVGAIGLWRMRRVNPDFFLLTLLIALAVIAWDSLVFVSYRYRMPLDLVLIPCAGLVYSAAIRRCLKPADARAPFPGGG